MNEHIRTKRILTVILYVCLCCVVALSTGCSTFVQALAREALDDGKHATIENKSFSRHFKDAFLEDLAGIQPVVDKTKK